MEVGRARGDPEAFPASRASEMRHELLDMLDWPLSLSPSPTLVWQEECAVSHLSSPGTPVTKGRAMRVRWRRRRPEAKRVNYVFALHYPSSSPCSERARERGHKSTLMRSGDRPAKRRREGEKKNANKNGSLRSGAAAARK